MAKPIFLIEVDEFISDEKYDSIKEYFGSKLPDYIVLIVIRDEEVSFKF